MRTIRLRAAFMSGAMAFLLAVAPLVAFAAAGDLDTTFGAGGKVTTDFNSTTNNAQAVAIQADGKIVAAGRCLVGGPDWDFCLARYSAAGVLDSTFDSDGRVTTAFSDRLDWVQAVAIQADQKIVAAGICNDSSGIADFCLARYNPDGTLDDTFDGDTSTGNGKVTTSIGVQQDQLGEIAIQTDQKIVAAGACSRYDAGNNPPTTSDFCLARYNVDGSLDTGFGGGGTGTVTTSILIVSSASGVAMQGDGKIVAAGACVGPASQFCLARYTAAGVLDTDVSTGFGPVSGSARTGTVITDITFDDQDRADAVAIQGDARIVAAGICRDTPEDLCVARYNSDGSLDTSFSGDGIVTTAIGPSRDFGRAVGIQDGKIVVAGTCGNSTTSAAADFCVARYTSTGLLDTSFSGDGIVTTPTGLSGDRPAALAVQADGKIVLAGTCVVSASEDFCVVRYLVAATGVPTLGEMIGIIASAPNLTSGQAAALTSKLNEAQAAYDAGKVNTACGKLGSFIGQVTGLVPDKLSAETAATLIAGANALKLTYGCT